MEQVIVYPSGDGIAVAYPADRSLSIEQAAQATVPNGVPHRVVNVADLPQDTAYRDAWSANFDDEPCVVTVDPAKKEAVDAALNAKAVEVWFASAITEGFTTPDGWTLGLENSDVALLTGNYVLAKEADALGLPLPQIVDRNGVPHSFDNLADMTALMLAYGQYRAALSAQYASRKSEASE